MIVFNKIGELQKLLDVEAQQILHTEPNFIASKIKNDMAKPKSGHIYKRRSIEHRASAPGESPAIDTGHYANSVLTKVQGKQAAVYSDAPQALALEFGRPEKNLMPRPIWRKEANLSLRRIRRRLAKFNKRIENV